MGRPARKARVSTRSGNAACYSIPIDFRGVKPRNLFASACRILVQKMRVVKNPILPLAVVLTTLVLCGLLTGYRTPLAPVFLLGAGLMGAWTLSKRMYGDLFSPFCIYLSTWLGGLLLFSLRLIDYYPLSTPTILLFASSMIAFASGCMLPISFQKRRRSPGTTHETSTPPPHRRNVERALLTVTVLDGAGLVLLPLQYELLPSYFSTFFTPGGALFIPIDYERLVGNFPLFLVPLEGLYLLCFLLAIYYLVRFDHPSKLALVPIASVIFRIVLVPNRAPMVALIFAGCFVYLHVRKPRISLRLLGVGLVVLTLAVGYFHFIGARLYKSVMYQEDIYSRDLAVAPQYYWLVDPYIYATSPFAGFEAMTSHLGTHTYGDQTFYPVIQFMNRVTGSTRTVSFTSYVFYNVPIPCNVYTYLGQFYTDFGWPGVLFFPFLLGLASTFCYLRMRKYGGLSSTLGTAAFNAFFIFSIFTNLFVLVTIWETFFLIFVLGRIVGRTRAPQRAASSQGTHPARGPAPAWRPNHAVKLE